MGMEIAAVSQGSGRSTSANEVFPQRSGTTANDAAGDVPNSVNYKDFEISLPGSGKVASDLQQVSLAFNRKLKFVINQESKEILIKVIDSETDKVIKVLPPEELQRLHSKIRETMGFLFDERV